MRPHLNETSPCRVRRRGAGDRRGQMAGPWRSTRQTMIAPAEMTQFDAEHDDEEYQGHHPKGICRSIVRTVTHIASIMRSSTAVRPWDRPIDPVAAPALIALSPTLPNRRARVRGKFVVKCNNL